MYVDLVNILRRGFSSQDMLSVVPKQQLLLLRGRALNYKRYKVLPVEGGRGTCGIFYDNVAGISRGEHNGCANPC